MQNDILRLRTRLPDERISLAENDRSLEVHIAHSPLREVEILHDQLLARFAADPALTPDQVVVLTPTLNVMRPSSRRCSPRARAARGFPTASPTVACAPRCR